jgi:hypothetical protein
MAPKQQAALLPLQAASPPPAAAATPPPAAAAAAATRLARGLTAARFYSAVAAALDDDNKATITQVRAVLLAVRKVVVREFAQEARQVTVPHVCRFSVRRLPARVASTKLAFGKQVELKQREARRTVKSTPAKTLKDDFFALAGAL